MATTTTTVEKEVRVTKAQRYEDIKALLSGTEVHYGTTAADAIAFIDKEMETLSKKRSGDSKKRAELQTLNKSLQSIILDYLANLPEDVEGATCNEINRSCPELAPLTGQKVAYLMRELKAQGKVDKKEVKGKMLYWLVEEETEEA